MHARYTQKEIDLVVFLFLGLLHDRRAFSVSTNDKEHIFSTFVCFVYVLPLLFSTSSSSCFTNEPTDEDRKKIKAIYFKHSEIVWCDDGLLNFCFLSISFTYAFVNVCLTIIVAVELRVSSISHLFISLFFWQHNTQTRKTSFCYSSPASTIIPSLHISLLFARTYAQYLHTLRHCTFSDRIRSTMVVSSKFISTMP